MKTILVPTDFSKNADKALDYAVLLAKKYESRIILLHAYSMTYISTDVPLQYQWEEMDSIKKAAEKKLTKLSEKINVIENVPCKTINVQGLAADLILDTIKSKKIGLVVMGAVGSSGIAGVLMGSITTKVVRLAECPVIAVPAKNKSVDIKNIVYATDFHSSDIDSLKQLAKLANVFNAVINIVHIADGEYLKSDEKNRFENFILKVKQKINYAAIESHLLYSTDIEKKLEQYIKKASADMLVVSTKHRNIIERLLEKSTTKQLVYRTKIPVLVFHYKQEPVVLI